MKVRSPALHGSEQQTIKEEPAGHLKKLAYYDSIIFLHYGKDVTPLPETVIKKGSHWLRGPQVASDEELLLSDWCKKCCIGCYE